MAASIPSDISLLLVCILKCLTSIFRHTVPLYWPQVFIVLYFLLHDLQKGKTALVIHPTHQTSRESWHTQTNQQGIISKEWLFFVV